MKFTIEQIAALKVWIKAKAWFDKETKPAYGKRGYDPECIKARDTAIAGLRTVFTNDEVTILTIVSLEKLAKAIEISESTPA